MDRKLYGNRTLSPLFQTTTNRPFCLMPCFPTTIGTTGLEIARESGLHR